MTRGGAGAVAGLPSAAGVATGPASMAGAASATPSAVGRACAPAAANSTAELPSAMGTVVDMAFALAGGAAAGLPSAVGTATGAGFAPAAATLAAGLPCAVGTAAGTVFALGQRPRRRGCPPRQQARRSHWLRCMRRWGCRLRLARWRARLAQPAPPPAAPRALRTSPPPCTRGRTTDAVCQAAMPPSAPPSGSPEGPCNALKTHGESDAAFCPPCNFVTSTCLLS